MEDDDNEEGDEVVIDREGEADDHTTIVSYWRPTSQTQNLPMQDYTEFENGNTDELCGSLGLRRHNADIVLATLGLDIGVSLLLTFSRVERGILSRRTSLDIEGWIMAVIVCVGILWLSVMRIWRSCQL